MVVDYGITWQYIVEKMRNKYDIAPNSTEKFSFGEIEGYLEKIWDEYFNMLYEQENYINNLKDTTTTSTTLKCLR